jgi:uncharacterized protein (TIGR03086 family)
MTAALAGAVELLDRSLSYTRVALAEVAGNRDTDETPCRGWPLARLLAHMDDALDAYTESSTGRLSLTPSSGRAGLDSIRTKACDLLAWWLERPVAGVTIGDRWLPADVLLGAAALEITVHGWDLHRTSGRDVPVPDDLAGPLLDVARAVVPGDRLPCFAPPVPVAPSATASERLLGLAGRT